MWLQVARKDDRSERVSDDDHVRAGDEPHEERREHVCLTCVGNKFRHEFLGGRHWRVSSIALRAGLRRDRRRHSGNLGRP